jgi:hypothetical protein
MYSCCYRLISFLLRGELRSASGGEAKSPQILFLCCLQRNLDEASVASASGGLTVEILLSFFVSRQSSVVRLTTSKTFHDSSLTIHEIAGSKVRKTLHVKRYGIYI